MNEVYTLFILQAIILIQPIGVIQSISQGVDKVTVTTVSYIYSRLEYSQSMLIRSGTGETVVVAASLKPSDSGVLYRRYHIYTPTVSVLQRTSSHCVGIYKVA